MTQALFSRTLVYFERPGHAQTGLMGVEWGQVGLGQPLIPAPVGWVTVPSQGLIVKTTAFTLGGGGSEESACWVPGHENTSYFPIILWQLCCPQKSLAQCLWKFTGT